MENVHVALERRRQLETQQHAHQEEKNIMKTLFVYYERKKKAPEGFLLQGLKNKGCTELLSHS